MAIADPSAGTADLLTRVAVVASRLEIDTGPLWTALPRLGTAPAVYARVWLGAAADRLALAARVQDGAAPPAPLPGGRPGEVELELGTVPDQAAVAETVRVRGTRSLAEDLAVLAAGEVTAPAREELARRLVRIADGRCDVLARREELGYLTWSAAIESGGTLPEVMQVLAPLDALADAVGAPVRARRLLQQAHLALAAPHGFAIAVACDAADALPVLVVTYRAVPWRQAVGLTDALTGATCGPTLGALAGGLDAPQADLLELTLHGGAPPTVRVGIERRGAAAAPR